MDKIEALARGDALPGANAGWCRRALLSGLGGALLAAPFIRPARAAGFPQRPIEVVTHAGVGGGTDITARMMMMQAPAELGGEMTVVNKTGGSGAAAIAYAASRPKDGHTLLLVTQSHILTMLRMRLPVQFDDLVPLARGTADAQVVMVRAGGPLRSADALREQGRSRSLKIGVTAVGSLDHVASFGFARAAALQPLSAVPFRGGGDIVVNLVGGNIDIGLLNYAEAESQITAGEVRPLLVLSDARIAALPDTPTAKEAGIDFSATVARGYCVLKGTPEDRVAKLREGLVRAMRTPAYGNYLASSGQSADSVAGAEGWARQLAEYQALSREALAELGLAR
ncbi:Bug family tripartite tricarboxylate transporter substrate binding protein [Teichococcus aestuarii]|uniref:Bug family tripartite tricarboxylate transporter substrate binding protein n=1 Tax=Teichococcus aestuarii TaxID=568898 RepID=UPI00361521FB